jgi:CDP-diacylglycerol--glycerol-3-phosphate 3-phosphatidyltransferase
MLRHLPNALTLFRIGAIPVIALFMTLGWHGMAFVLFVVAVMTDFLDGLAARWLKQSSKLGVMLDPIADKVLAACVLLLLTAEGVVQGWHLIPALVILAREVLVSGLREYLAGLQVSLPVTFAAKGKTAVQFVALAALVLAPAVPVETSKSIYITGYALLWIAAALTAVTGYAYFRAGWAHMDGGEGAAK